MNQNKIFIEGEGDAWFNRNCNYIQDIEQIKKSPDVSYLLETLDPYNNKIQKVLEIGCSSGFKLEAICAGLNAEGEGIEPSVSAVNSGNKRNKISKISLQVGTGESLSFKEATFDLVYFAFCLYLFDRKTLVQSLAEADRVLRPGGFLVITDFDPGSRYKRPYSHFDGIFSYKQDYSSFYVQTGLYYLLGKRSFSHGSRVFDESRDERVSTHVLYKEIEPYPCVSSL